jgi:hypothetical protein
MGLDIRIDSYDISDMDERLERAFDIRNEFGDMAVKPGNEMETDQEIIGYADGTVHAVLQTQQELINKLSKDMQVIYDRNRDLEQKVSDLQIALLASGKAFRKAGGK